MKRISCIALVILASCGEKEAPPVLPADPPKAHQVTESAAQLTERQQVASVTPKPQETPPTPPAAPARLPLYTLEKAQECDNLYQLKLHEDLDPKCLDKNLGRLVRSCLGDHSVDVYSYLAEKYSGRPEFNQQFMTICDLWYGALEPKNFTGDNKFLNKNIRYSKDKNIAYFVFKYNKYKIKVNRSTVNDTSNVFFNLLRKKIYDENDLLLVKFLMSQGCHFNTTQWNDDEKNPKLMEMKKTWDGVVTPLDVAIAYESEGTAMQDLLREYGARTVQELLQDPRTPRTSPIAGQESYRLKNTVCIPYTYEQKPDPKAVAKYAAEVQAWVDYYEKGGFARDRAAREEAAKAEYDFWVSKGMKTVAPGSYRK